MGAERRESPEWARREREGDLAWIQENASVIQFVAQTALEASGRGVVVVDTTFNPPPEFGQAFAYFSQEIVDKDYDEDTKRMVREYDPDHEFVLVLLKPEDRTSTYRIRPHWSQPGPED